MHSLPIDFTSKKISPWGGIHLFHNVYQRYGIREFLQTLDLPQPGSNRGFDPVQIVESFLVSVVLGSRRLAHSGMLRTDEVIRDIFGWKKSAPSASTLSRFFQKFDKELNDKVFPAIQKRVFEQIAIKKMTIDIDSTSITRYGEQELARKGYNPGQRGKASHAPLMAFCDDVKMALNAWMRSGDSHSSTDAVEFIDELFEIVSRERIGMIRMDSGFYSQHILKKLEDDEEPVNYIVKAKMTKKLRSQIESLCDWHSRSDNDIQAEYSELDYTATNWDVARRIAVCRIPVRSNSKSGELLFPEMKQYDYYAFVTNTDLSCSMVHDIYKKRGDCENIIKELKHDYSIDGFALHGFYPMEAAFRWIMLAYNIMVIFKQSVLTSKHRHRLSTIKFQCIALGSYVVKNGRNKTLKLSAEGRRRHFLEKIFMRVELLPYNFTVSNA